MVSVQRICYANDAQLWLILFQGTPVLTVLQDVSVSKLKHLKLALVLSGGYPQQVPHRRQRHAFPSGIWVATSSAHRRCNPRCFVLLRHCGLHEVALLSIIFQSEPLSTSPPHTFSVPYCRHGEVQALVVCVQRCQVSLFSLFMHVRSDPCEVIGQSTWNSPRYQLLHMVMTRDGMITIVTDGNSINLFWWMHQQKCKEEAWCVWLCLYALANGFQDWLEWWSNLTEVQAFEKLGLIARCGVSTGRAYCGVCGSAERDSFARQTHIRHVYVKIKSLIIINYMGLPHMIDEFLHDVVAPFAVSLQLLPVCCNRFLAWRLVGFWIDRRWTFWWTDRWTKYSPGKSWVCLRWFFIFPMGNPPWLGNLYIVHIFYFLGTP